jgi:heavy metal sensor kinase
MARSLRRRLQVWHALTLLVVVAGFGSVLYYQVWETTLGTIDAELQAGARVLEGSLRGFPPHLLEDGKGPPPPKKKQGKGPPPPGADDFHLRWLDLPAPFRHRHEDQPDEMPYFVIWRADGSLVAASPRPNDGPPPEFPGWPRDEPNVFRSWQRGAFREGIVLGPRRTIVLVGRGVEREMQALHWFAGKLMLTGLGVLGIGLVGGWMLSRGAIRSIERMSATAASISVSNLSRRIDSTGIDRELAELAGILNDMFARLQSAFERQTRFTADASHELRTPLSIIHSHVELALARPRSAEEYRDAFETCLRAARRMRGLVEGLLTLARLDAGKLEVQRQRIDLGALVEESAGLLAALAEQKGVVMNVRAVRVEMVGDAGQLAQVATNLLTNAIHYNRPGGEVTATLDADEQTAVLTVADTGCGIPGEDQAHIFERFYRVDKARSREQGGSGLGLAICKSIVEAHGGSIGFTSEASQGTTFVVRLPR